MMGKPEIRRHLLTEHRLQNDILQKVSTVLEVLIWSFFDLCLSFTDANFCYFVAGLQFDILSYRTRAIINRSWFEAALVYKPRILGLKIEEFPFLVHNWSVT